VTDRKYVVVGTAAETTITVTRESASTERSQGLALEADHELCVGDIAATSLVLWADTAPEMIEITTGDAGHLRMWNVWRDGDLIQAWEGGARIDVDDEGDDLGLVCHDGHGGNGPDLVIRLSFDRAWTQPSDD
jgi:phosphodiesterase/alkaline phosphatase D-like protein